MRAVKEDHEDEQLVSLAAAGDRLAFEELVRRYEAKIRGFCHRMLKERTQAEDAAQEVFFKAFSSLKNFKQDALFSTWIFRIANNHCIDCCRKNRLLKWMQFFSSSSKQELDDNGSIQYSSSNGYESAQLLEKLLSKLSPLNRSLILMHEAFGFSYQELATTQNCSIDSIKSRLKRVRDTVNQARLELERE